jgi:glycosyltransferase involved in cell wall biosynthesis
MDFSVVIPSRNRGQLVRRAIGSVLEQTHPSLEVIVVNDGSDGDQAATYATLTAAFGARLRLIDLPPLVGGHGSSYAYNRGAEAASGTYICMLDDDDLWCDPGHLARAWTCLSGSGAEAYFANQAAFQGAEQVRKSIWLEPIEAVLQARGARADGAAYAVSVADLVQCGNFCHFNTTIVSRALYQRLRGMHEFIRYENDRDFYLRVIDQARGILYYPGTVARHEVPDAARAANASTSLSYLQKMLYRSYIYDKARIGSRHAAIRSLATLHQGYTLRRIAERLLVEGRVIAAYRFAAEALLANFSFKWMLYCLYLGMRAGAGADTSAVKAHTP